MTNTRFGLFGLGEFVVSPNNGSFDSEKKHLKWFNDSLGNQLIFTFNENVRFIDDYQNETQIALSDSGIRVLFLDKETGEFTHKEELGYTRFFRFDGSMRRLFFVKNDRELYSYDIENEQVKLVVALETKIKDYYPIGHGRVVVRSDGGKVSGLNGQQIARLTMFDYEQDTFVAINDREDVGMSLKIGTYKKNEKVFFMTERKDGFETIGTYDLQTGESRTFVTSVWLATNLTPISDSVFAVTRLTSARNFYGYLNINTFVYKDVFRDIDFSPDRQFKGNWYVATYHDLNRPYNEDTVNILNNKMIAKVKPRDSMTYLFNIETLEAKELGIFVDGNKWRPNYYRSLLNGVGMIFPESGLYVTCSPGAVATNRFFGPKVTSVKKVQVADVTIYPNPTSGAISIRTNSLVRSVEVIDQNGRTVYKGQSQNISSLPKGVNTVIVYTNEGLVTKKVVSF